MTQNQAFDWYQIFKMNEQNPNINEFAKAIRLAHFGPEINKVPTSLKQKLLLLFQNSSLSMQKQYEKDKSQVKDLKQQRIQLNTQIYKLKNQLNASKQKINTDNVLIEEKLRIIEKMKDKIKKKKQEKKVPQQVYFCPMCLKQDFPSRDQFSIHLINEHSKNMQPQKPSGEQQIPSDLKDFILSLKDKQMQMMEMMMNKKKQIQTIQLEQIYANSMRKLQNQPNFLDRKSIHTTQVGKGRFPTPNDDIQIGEQLQGQSQYLFYPPDQKYYQGIFHEKLHQQRVSLQNIPQTLSNYGHHKINYQRPSREFNMNSSTKPDYYNIFGTDLTISQVENNLTPQKQEINTNRQIEIEDRISENSKNSSKRDLEEKQRRMAQKERTLKEKEEKRNIVPSIQQYIFQQKQNSLANISLSERSLEPRNKQIFGSNSFDSSKKYQSIYNESRKKISNGEGFIFNSGPLLDDHQSQDSDYQDYFGKGTREEENEQSVLDQEIKVIGKKNKYNKVSTVNRGFENNRIPKSIPNQNVNLDTGGRAEKSKRLEVNQSNFALEYSKDKGSLDHSNSKEKSSSDIIELSNSFSKRGLQSSKNQDQTINLSDLKLSKLQKQRQFRRQHQDQGKDNRQRVYKNENNVILPQIISFKYEMSKKEKNFYESDPKILQQFKKQQSHLQEYPHAIRKTENRRKQDNLKKYSIQQADMGRSNPGILNQFFINSRHQ